MEVERINDWVSKISDPFSENYGKYLIICRKCGKEFITKNIRQMYCKIQCKMATKAKRRRENNRTINEIVCQYCHETFIPTRNDAKYCSGKCKQVAYRERSNQKTQKKPYVLHLFIYPKEEWFDKKGDFKGHFGDNPGPMLTCAIMADSVKEIAKIPIVIKYIDVRIINNNEPDLLTKYTENIRWNGELPLMIFKETDKTITFPVGYLPHKDIVKWVLDSIEPLAEAEKLNMSLNEYHECIRELEAWKKEKEKARKRKEYRHKKKINLKQKHL